MKSLRPSWEHPGGKLIEEGPGSLTDEELVAILIGTGYKGRTAQDIAHDLLYHFYSFYGLLGKTAGRSGPDQGFEKRQDQPDRRGL